MLVAAFVGAACEKRGENPSITLAFGEAAPAEIIEGWDAAIAPDGDGLPLGSGDARRGKPLYERHCLACHGVGGLGGAAGDLVGGQGSLGGPTPKRTVGSYWPYATTLFDYVRRAMPYDRPGSLDANEVYALVAYVLAENDILGIDDVLDAETLPVVRMPNREGFPPTRSRNAGAN